MTRLCPIDGAPVASEMLEEFHVCSRCREILYPAETVTVFSRKSQREYLAATYPNGYDRPTPRVPSTLSRIRTRFSARKTARPSAIGA